MLIGIIDGDRESMIPEASCFELPHRRVHQVLAAGRRVAPPRVGRDKVGTEIECSHRARVCLSRETAAPDSSAWRSAGETPARSARFRSVHPRRRRSSLTSCPAPTDMRARADAATGVIVPRWEVGDISLEVNRTWLTPRSTAPKPFGPSTLATEVEASRWNPRGLEALSSQNSSDLFA
jgi:hypothetical protein